MEMDNIMKNIIITSAGKRVSLVRLFRNTIVDLGLDIKVYTTDMCPRLAPAGYESDGCFEVQPCTSDNYIDKLISICKDYNIGIVIPTIDTELNVLSGSWKRFHEEGINPIVSSSDFINICRDKRKTLLYFDSIGIPIPQEVDLASPIFPMFAKPYDGSLSSNIHIIRSKSDLTESIVTDPKLIFMEYIDPKEYVEYSVDMYYGLDNRVKSIVPRERIAIRAGEINKGITHKNYIVGLLKRVMGEIDGVRGSLCLQLFYRESDNDVKGIEINPRFGGGYPLSYYAGANFAEMLIREYLLHEDLVYSDDWKDNTLMLRYDDCVIVYE